MIRTRFAPSPTGYLHIGGVRTALFNWLFARGCGGQFVLRIDDTDRKRNVSEALQPILDGFRWLGIEWDEGPGVGGANGPYYQSQRSELYTAAVQVLLGKGAAYRDYSTTAEVQAEREAAEREKRPFAYSRRWMAETDDQAMQFENEGRQAVVRLKMPREGQCQFEDQIRGEVSFSWRQEQDHVIQRADGTCLYHLASVVDDHEMRISHVIRAEEHLSNTPRQIFISQSLGYELPEYAHLPYVAEPGGKSKISKRKLDKYLKNQDFKKLYEHGAAIARAIGLENTADTFNPVIVDFYQKVGYLPEAVINYLLLLGWSLDDQTEEFTREEMLQHFSLARVVKSPASFDPLKLLAFQERYMRKLPIQQKLSFVLPFLQQAGRISVPPPREIDSHVGKVLEAAGDRVKVAGDILQFDEFFVNDEDLEYDEKSFEKRVRKPEKAAELLNAIKHQLASVEPFDAHTLDQWLHDFVESRQIKIGQIIHAFRVATTGKSVGIGLFAALEIIGREGCLARIQRALDRIEVTRKVS